MSKKELHTTSLKEIASIWKNMSAEEKGNINVAKNAELQSEITKSKAPSPVEVSDNSDNSDDDSANCEEMEIDGKTYAVEIGSEPRTVYTLEGVEVGVYTESNGLICEDI